MRMEVSDNYDWYQKAKNQLLAQKKLLYDDMNVPNRYWKYCEIVNEIEKLNRWHRACSLLPRSPNPGPSNPSLPE